MKKCSFIERKALVWAISHTNHFQMPTPSCANLGTDPPCSILGTPNLGTSESISPSSPTHSALSLTPTIIAAEGSSSPEKCKRETPASSFSQTNIHGVKWKLPKDYSPSSSALSLSPEHHSSPMELALENEESSSSTKIPLISPDLELTASCGSFEESQQGGETTPNPTSDLNRCDTPSETPLRPEEAVCVFGLEPGQLMNPSIEAAPHYSPAHKVFDNMSTRGLNCTFPSSENRNNTHMIPESLPQPNAPRIDSWSSIVSNRSNLKYIPPLRHGEKLQLPKGLVQLGVEKWKHSLVGFFLDKQLPFSIVKDQANRLWKKYGLTDTLSSQKGIFIFKFENATGCHNVLTKGPWLMLGKPLRLQMWSKDIDINKHNFKTMEIWTNLYNIPLLYWTEEGLSAIASWLGKPLHLDDLTTTCQRISYARICIEISIDSEFPSSFMVESESNETFEVKVEYSWIPRRCTICNVFGHSQSSCPKGSKQEWRPKANVEPKKGETNRMRPQEPTNEVVPLESKNVWTTIPIKHQHCSTDISKTKQTLGVGSSNRFASLDRENVEPTLSGETSPASASPTSNALSRKIRIVDEIDDRKRKLMDSQYKAGSRGNQKLPD